MTNMTNNVQNRVLIFHDLENLAQNSGVDSIDLHFQECPWKMTFICIYNYLAPVEAQITKTHSRFCDLYNTDNIMRYTVYFIALR